MKYKILLIFLTASTFLNAGGPPPPPPKMPAIPGVQRSVYQNWDNSIQVAINGNFVPINSDEFENWIAQKPERIIPASVQFKLPSGLILKYSDRSPFMKWAASGYDPYFVLKAADEIPAAPGVKAKSATQQVGGLDINLGLLISNFRKYQAIDPQLDPVAAVDMLESLENILNIFDVETYENTFNNIKAKPVEPELQSFDGMEKWITTQKNAIEPLALEVRKEEEKKAQQMRDQLEKERERKKLQEEEDALNTIQELFEFIPSETIQAFTEKKEFYTFESQLNKMESLLKKYKDVLQKRNLSYDELTNLIQEKRNAIVERRNELGIKPPPKIMPGPMGSIPQKDWSRFPAGTKVTIKGSPQILEFPTSDEKINQFIDDKNFLLNVGTVTTPEGTIFNFPLAPLLTKPYDEWLKTLGAAPFVYPEEPREIPPLGQPKIIYSEQELIQKLSDLEIELMTLERAL